MGLILSALATKKKVIIMMMLRETWDDVYGLNRGDGFTGAHLFPNLLSALPKLTALLLPRQSYLHEVGVFVFFYCHVIRYE